MSKQKYDSTVARIAGNLLSGIAPTIKHSGEGYDFEVTPYKKASARWAVAMAREIVAEVQRTEPKDQPHE